MKFALLLAQPAVWILLLHSSALSLAERAAVATKATFSVEVHVCP